MTEQNYSKIPIIAKFIHEDLKKAVKKNQKKLKEQKLYTKTLYKKVQKAKKCEKCKYCLIKHITEEKTYKLCLWKTAKLFTLNNTVKGCKYYKKKEQKNV